MIVVADTSVILNLCRVQQDRLLQQLYHRVLIPSRVALEFENLAGTMPRFSGLVLPEWIGVVPDPVPLPNKIMQANLDAGEAAAIALCLNEKADAILMDEALGRMVAEQLGLRVIGILGVLVQSRHQGLLLKVQDVLNQLEKDANFWMSPHLRARVLRSVGEL
jgi:uncharacterized protein